MVHARVDRGAGGRGGMGRAGKGKGAGLGPFFACFVRLHCHGGRRVGLLLLIRLFFFVVFIGSEGVEGSDTAKQPSCHIQRGKRYRQGQ